MLKFLRIHTVKLYFFTAQWTQDETDKKLTNRNFNFEHKDIAWNIPASGATGYIEDTATGNVLGRHNAWNNDTIVLEAKSVPESDEQKWVRSISDSNGWFTLTNKASGKVLASTIGTETIEASKFIKL